MDTAAGLAGATQNVYNGSRARGAGVFSERRIEDVQIGDLVWSRDEGDPDAAVELKPVTALYRHTAYDLQDLDLSDGSGHVESLVVTDEHPFYVEGRGWTAADELLVGERVLGGGGKLLTVSGNADDYRQDGITVYNFEVGGDHTYFVADGAGEEDWAWAHNKCFDEKVADTVAKYGGNALERLDYYRFATRKSAKQAAAEIAGSLGPRPNVIRAMDFRGVPKRLAKSVGVIGRESLDGTVLWRHDWLGHFFKGNRVGPHFNVEIVVDGIRRNLHLFY